MALDIAWLDAYLVKLLVDENGDMWDQDIRRRAINEALVAVVRLRPEIYSIEVNIPINTDRYTFTLPDTADHWLAVYGVIEPADNGTVERSLKVKSERDALNEDPCWRGLDGPASFFVYNPDVAPYTVYLYGNAPAGSTLRSRVQPTVPMLTSSSGSLPIRASFIPDIVDYALARLYTREDSPPARMQFHGQMFREGVADKLQTDAARNPYIHLLDRQNQ